MQRNFKKNQSTLPLGFRFHSNRKTRKDLIRIKENKKPTKRDLLMEVN